MLLIEGYASLFGVEDLAGDVVRAGAFARTLAAGGAVPMLLQHRGGQAAGRWTTIREDGRGLFVRGLLIPEAPTGRMAISLVRDGALGGLSIGFLARSWSPRPAGGRDLKVIDLREVSLVTQPMLPRAGFTVLAAPLRNAA